MNLEVNEILLISICDGCLSADRNLTKLSREKTQEIFQEFLNYFVAIRNSVLLCWECVAYLRKIIKFKNQVQYAQEYLQKQTYHGETFSKLKITKTDTYTSTDISKYIFENQNNLETLKSQSNSVNLCNNALNPIKYEINAENNLELNKNTLGLNNSMEKLTKVVDNGNWLNSDDLRYKVGTELLPVKIEDNCEDFNDLTESLYVDEHFDQIELVGGHFQEINKNKFKDNNSTEDFNDSDDEPLEKIKTEKTNKKRRKKKQQNVKASVSKREQEAGVVKNARVARKLEKLNVASGMLDMIVLSWEQVEEERQKGLQSVTFTRHEYKCYDCVIGFNHKFKLDNHMKKHDPEGGASVCSVCRVRCRDAHALAAHRRRHRVRWSCGGCEGRWSRAGVAADHLARVHGAPSPQHPCSHCDHTAPTLSELRRHMKIHCGDGHKCELCGKIFTDRTSLRTHLFIHKGEKEYACPQCDKRFLFKKAMEVHLVTHDAPAHLYCHQCDVNFKNHMSYYQHMKYNLKHIDPEKLKYACELCDKKFVKAIRLEEHNLAVHLKRTPIQCAVDGCQFSCSSRAVLRTHTRMIHRDCRTQRNHVCHTCGKAYTTKKTLEGHIRSHTGERPFKCNHCPSTFGYEAALYNHNKLVHLKPKNGRGRVMMTNTLNTPSVQQLVISSDVITGANIWTNVTQQTANTQ